jgi:excisionase family DNA binding protein
MNTENLPDILTVPEIAHYLKLSKVMVYKLVEEGRMPHYRIGRAVRVSRDQFLHWLETQKAVN